MLFLTKLFKFYINANIHVSLAAASMLLVVERFFNVERGEGALILFCSTFISYNFIRWRKWRKGELKLEMKAWFESSLKRLKFLNILLTSLLVYLLLDVQLITFVVLLPFCLVTLFYMIPVFKRQHRRYSLRVVPGIKIFSIAFSWAGLSVGFVAAQNNILSEVKVFWLFVTMFLFVIALTLPFDIRDRYFDSDKLKTLPQVFGVKISKIIGSLCLLIVVLIDSLVFKLNISTLLVTLVLGILLLKSTTNQSLYFSSFGVESVPIVWYLLTFIGLGQVF